MRLRLGQVYDSLHACDLEHLFVGELIIPDEQLVPEFLRTAVTYLFDKHPVLSAKFHHCSDGWQMLLGDCDHDSVTAALSIVAFESEATGLAQIHRLIRTVQAQGLQARPLLRYVLFESTATGEQRLLILFHHLICDGISSRILWRDLSHAYLAAAQGEPQRAKRCDSYQHLALELEQRHLHCAVQVTQEFAPKGLLDKLCQEHCGQTLRSQLVTHTALLEPEALIELSRQARHWQVTVGDLLLGHWICALSRLQPAGSVGLMMWVSPHFVGQWDTCVTDLVGSVSFPIPVQFDLCRCTLREHVQKAAAELGVALDSAQAYAVRYFSGAPGAAHATLPAVGFNFVNSQRPSRRLLGYRLAPEALDIPRAPEQLAELALSFEAEVYEQSMKLTVHAVPGLERQLAIHAWTQALFEGLRTVEHAAC